MANPGGNYPGRQIMIGGLKNGLPAFVYFGSGRSRPSKERYVQMYEDGCVMRINPLDPNEPFDIFRHYQAVRIDPKTGFLVVSNSQAPNDAVFEAFRYMTEEEKVSNRPSDYVFDLLKTIGPEYDNRIIKDDGTVVIDEKKEPTPRIIGIIFPTESDSHGQSDFYFTYGYVTGRHGEALNPFSNTRPLVNDGFLDYWQTYDGQVDPYVPCDFQSPYFLGTDAKTSVELSNEVYDISDYEDPKYGILRAWSLAGVRNGNGPGGWDVAVRDPKRPDGAVRLSL